MGVAAAALQIEQKGRKGSMRRDVRTKDVKMDDGVKGKIEEEVRGRSREKGEVDEGSFVFFHLVQSVTYRDQGEHRSRDYYM